MITRQRERFCSRRYRANAAALVLAFAGFTLSSRSSAIVIGPNGVRLEQSEFPAGGVVTGFMDFGEFVPAEFSVTDSEGNVIAGEFLELPEGMISADFAWLSEQPLAPGEYEVSYLGELSFFSVVEDASSVSALAEVTEYRVPVGEPLYCEEYAPGSEPEGIFPSRQVAARIAVRYQGVHATQYAYTAFDEDQPVDLHFGVEPREVCLEITGTHLANGSTIQVSVNCVDTGELPNLGMIEEGYSAPSGALESCTVPPEGLEEEWCDALLGLQIVPPPAESEEAAMKTCEQSTADDPEVEEQDMEEQDEESSDSKSEDKGGCSVAGVPSSRAGAPLGVLVLGAGLWLSYRGRRQRRLPARDQRI